MQFAHVRADKIDNGDDGDIYGNPHDDRDFVFGWMIDLLLFVMMCQFKPGFQPCIMCNCGRAVFQCMQPGDPVLTFRRILPAFQILQLIETQYNLVSGFPDGFLFQDRGSQMPGEFERSLNMAFMECKLLLLLPDQTRFRLCHQSTVKSPLL